MGEFVRLTMRNGDPIWFRLETLVAMTKTEIGTSLWTVGDTGEADAWVIQEAPEEVLAKIKPARKPARKPAQKKGN